MQKGKAVLTFCILFLCSFYSASSHRIQIQPNAQPPTIPPPPLPIFGFMAANFNTYTFLVAGDTAYCMDVLGAGKIAFGLAEGGVTESPEGRTDLLLTQQEFDTGNLIPVGGPAINPVTGHFNLAFGVEYNYDPGGTPPVFEISAVGVTITLNLEDYPGEDICIIYLREHNGRKVMLVWGYGWRGTYAGSLFIGNPENWETYYQSNMVMLRWRDSNGDRLVQVDEIHVEQFTEVP